MVSGLTCGCFHRPMNATMEYRINSEALSATSVLLSLHSGVCDMCSRNQVEEDRF